MRFLNKIFNSLTFELRNLISLSIASALNHGIRLITGVLNANILSPYLYGINTITNTFSRYSNYLQLGAQNGLNRQIPIDIGGKKEDEVRLNLMTVFWFLTCISLFLFIIFFILSIFNYKIEILPSEYYLETSLLAITGIFAAYFTSYLVSTQKFTLLSKLRIWVDTSMALLTVLLVYFFKLHGLMFGIIFGNTLFCLLTISLSKFKIQKYFSFEKLFLLLESGFPIMLGSSIFLFYSTIDIVFLSHTIDSNELGIYGFALTGVAAYRVYATSLSDILSPKMGKLFGKNKDSLVLYLFIKKYNDMFIISLGIIVAFFFFAIPAIIESFLPKYFTSIVPFKILLLSAFALTIYIPSGIIITILKKNWLYIIVLLLVSISTYMAFNYFIKSNYINNVPKILFMMSTIFSLVIIQLSVYLTTGKFLLGILVKSLLTFSTIVGIILIINSIVLNLDENLIVNSILNGLIKISISVIVLLTLLVIRYKKSILSILSKNLNERNN